MPSIDRWLYERFGYRQRRSRSRERARKEAEQQQKAEKQRERHRRLRLGPTGYAVEFLRSLLANGRLPASMIEAEREKAGVSKSALRRAKEKLAVKSVKGATANAPWYWELPPKVS